MDEFGVLVESIGFRAHGKSAPIAKSKGPKPSNSHFNTTVNNSPSFNQSSSTLPVDELDGIFRSNVNSSKAQHQPQNYFTDDDVFGGPVSSSKQFGGFDLESVLNNNNNNNNNNSSSHRKSSSNLSSHSYDDLLGLKSKPRGGIDDDLFGSFGVRDSSSGNGEKKKVPAFDDLIPGFGGDAAAAPSKNKVYSGAKLSPPPSGNPSKTCSTVTDDPFLVFESSVSHSDASWPFASPSGQDIGKRSAQPSIFDLDDFPFGGPKSGSKFNGLSGTPSNGHENVSDLDDIFGGGNAVRQNAPASSTNQDSPFGDFFHEVKGPAVKQTSSDSSFNKKKVSVAVNVGNDYSSLFGDITTSSGEFHEIEGEPPERRAARRKRYLDMKGRMAEAVAEMNQRDLQSQREHEEKRRFAKTLDSDIKRWAAGKEGNLRALLSSLQQVLWPECGWHPVSLTDMITSESVKKVYKKAALFVHPDKVQQRGANIQQKYVAEKVFDILKEAWNKFNAEELR